MAREIVGIKVWKDLDILDILDRPGDSRLSTMSTMSTFFPTLMSQKLALAQTFGLALQGRMKI